MKERMKTKKILASFLPIDKEKGVHGRILYMKALNDI